MADVTKKIVTVDNLKEFKTKNDSLYATKTEVAGKQGALSQAQLNAANSGITAAKVTTYDGYATSKQDTLSFDSAPTEGSTNPVTSGGVYSAISALTGFKAEVVTSLPEKGTDGVLYLMSHTHGTGDSYDEYVWVSSNSSFEKVGNTDVDLSGYQTKLTDAQVNAMNSGITAAKVTAYDAYADTISGKQNALTDTQLSAVNSGITSDKVTTYDGYATSKQNALTTAQLSAVNSGITTAKVTTYDGYGWKKESGETTINDDIGTVQTWSANLGTASTSATDKSLMYILFDSETVSSNPVEMIASYLALRTDTKRFGGLINHFDTTNGNTYEWQQFALESEVTEKQDKLTPGDNITISDNTISASFTFAEDSDIDALFA